MFFDSYFVERKVDSNWNSKLSIRSCCDLDLWDYMFRNSPSLIEQEDVALKIASWQKLTRSPSEFSPRFDQGAYMSRSFVACEKRNLSKFNLSRYTDSSFSYDVVRVWLIWNVFHFRIIETSCMFFLSLERFSTIAYIFTYTKQKKCKDILHRYSDKLRVHWIWHSNNSKSAILRHRMFVCYSL